MDNNIMGRSQNVLVKCFDIMSDHNVKLAGQCPMTDCYFQDYNNFSSFTLVVNGS